MSVTDTGPLASDSSGSAVSVPPGVTPRARVNAQAGGADDTVHENRRSRRARAQRLIILPALNEELGLASTFAQLRAVQFDPDGDRPTILVVDGHSEDRTVEVAREGGAEILVQSGRGKGAAIRESFQWALEHGFDQIGVIDADGTYPAEMLPALFTLLELEWEVVIGIRRPDSELSEAPREWVHRIGNHFLNYCAAQLSRSPLLDVCSGFWGLRRSALERLDLESNGFEIEAELFVKAFRNHLKVAQLPVSYHRRIGSAKLHTARDGARILSSILTHSLRGAGVPAKVPARPRPARMPPAALVSSLLITLDSGRVFLVAPPERRTEAETIARRLSVACPGTQIETATASGEAFTRAGPAMLPSRTSNGPNVEPTVVVRLPPQLPEQTSRSTAVITLPHSDRVLRIPALDTYSAGQLVQRSVAGFQLEDAGTARAGARTVLNASLDPTGSQRELALVRANAGDYGVAVFRPLPGTSSTREWPVSSERWLRADSSLARRG